MRALPITLIHVVAPPVVSWPVVALYENIAELQQDNARQIIEQARKTVEAAGAQSQPDVFSEVMIGNVVPTLVDASKTAEMVVTGSRGAGVISSALLGSVSAGLVHHAHGPVAVIRSDQDPVAKAHAPVLLGIDGSRASEGATALAFEEASRRRVPLIALHVWSDVGVFPVLGMDWREYEEQGQEILGERLAGWQEQYPDVAVQRRLECDQPAHWLIEESRHAQLVVVGSHGRGGFTGMLLGSVSSAVAQSAAVPVIVVRSR